VNASKSGKTVGNYSKLLLCKATRYVQNWGYLFGFCIDIAFEVAKHLKKIYKCEKYKNM